MMNKIVKIRIAIILFIIFSTVGIAQETAPYGPQPEIGKPMPDFTLDHVTHYKKKTATLEDFKGKWLFMDFWFTGCKACIKSFPKVNAFKEKFKDRIEWIMVGMNNKAHNGGFNNRGIEELYEKFRKIQDLSMVAAYDSVLIPKWGIRKFPHIKIIDPNGILYAVTNGTDITEEKIKELLEGKKPKFGRPKLEYDEWDPGLLTSFDVESGSLWSKNSMLVKYKNNDLVRSPSINSFWDDQAKDNENHDIYFIDAGPNLEKLYFQAYIGADYFDRNSSDMLYEKVYPVAVLEIEDTTLFVPKRLYNKKVMQGQEKYKGQSVFEIEGFYNYALRISSKKNISKKHLMQAMQEDLKNYFGYEVSVERRKMPVWNMIEKEEGVLKKIMSKGGKKSYGEQMGMSGNPTGFTWVNVPGDQLLPKMIRYLYSWEGPFFDKTGLTADMGIDVTIKGDLTHLEGVREALQKVGLDLVREEKEFEKVLVIKDPKPKDYTLNMKEKDSLRADKLIQTYITSKSEKPDWDALKRGLEEKYPTAADRILSKAKVTYAIDRKDWKNFEPYVIYYMDNYRDKVDVSLHNKYAWLLFKYGSSNTSLTKAWQWSYGIIEKNRYKNKVDFWYTYANIVYKQNRNGFIKLMEKRVIEKDPDNKMYQETLEKMKRGEPTWENEIDNATAPFNKDPGK